MEIMNSNGVTFGSLAYLKTNGKNGKQVQISNIDSSTINKISDKYDVSGIYKQDIKPFSKEQKFINALRKALGIKKSQLGKIDSIMHRGDLLQIKGKSESIEKDA